MDTLLVGILPHNHGDHFVQTAKKAGSGGGTVIMGRGSTENVVLHLLGLGDITYEMVFILVTRAEHGPIRQALVDFAAHKHRNYGVLFDLDITTFMKTGTLTRSESVTNPKKESTMHTHPYELITVIVNKGFADDAMAAARAAGAGGGTIIFAHGTGTEADAKFFGVTIVPEKEMLMILVEHGKAAPVVDAIRTLPCLAQPGSGIAFCMDVTDFTVLGKK